MCNSTWLLRWQPQLTTYKSLNAKAAPTLTHPILLPTPTCDHTASTLHSKFHTSWQLLLNFGLNLFFWVTKQSAKAEIICKLSLTLVVRTCISFIYKINTSDKLFLFLGPAPCCITAGCFGRLLNIIGRPTFCVREREAIYLCLMSACNTQSDAG